MKKLLFLALIIVFISSSDVLADPSDIEGETVDLRFLRAGLVGAVLEEFKEGEIYKVLAKFPFVKSVETGEDGLIIYKDTEILVRDVVIKKNQNLIYFIPLDKESQGKEKGVKKYELYFFDNSHNPFIYFREWTSLAHGTLIVPFKLRTKDGQLTGDATLGYYVGKVLKFRDLDLIPLISAGITPITVSIDSENTETKLGVTAALGVVLKHSGNFQVGIVSGIDHLGGSAGDEFEYENDFWVSFMVGYSFAN
jgi:hypothetical protein